jgi:hypothetical protein
MKKEKLLLFINVMFVIAIVIYFFIIKADFSLLNLAIIGSPVLILIGQYVDYKNKLK